MRETPGLIKKTCFSRHVVCWLLLEADITTHCALNLTKETFQTKYHHIFVINNAIN
jgi:hypothetical protein